MTDVRARQLQRRAHPRVQLAGVPDDPVADEQLRAAARVPRRPLARAHGQLDARGGGDQPGGLRPRRPSPPAGPAPTSRAARGCRPARRPRATAAPARRRAARPASRRPDGRSTPGSGAGVRSPPGNTAPCSNSARSRWPRERLRASVASRPGSSVVRSARLLLRQRVAHDDDLRGAGRRRAGRARPAPPSRRTGRTAPRRSPASASVRPTLRRRRCTSVSPRPGRRRRQHRRDVVVAGEPDDLLDQVGRVGQVGPPGRRRDRRAGCRSRRRRSRRRSRSSTTWAGGVRHAGDPGRAWRRPAGCVGRGAAGVDVDHPADDPRAAVLGEQLGGPGERDHGHLRVDAALEPLGRLAGQPVPAGGAGDAGGLPVRRLEQHVRRAVADLGRRAAHDGGQADRAGVVGDQQVVGRELPRSCRRGWSASRPRAASRTVIGPVTASRSKACIGWPSSSIT